MLLLLSNLKSKYPKLVNIGMLTLFLSRSDSASDMDMDSDDDGDNNGAAPPSKARFASGRSQDNDSDEEGGEDLEELYPIEGKYKDEGDRER